MERIKAVFAVLGLDDVVGLVGLAMLGYGLALVSTALALIVVGGILLALAVWRL